MSQVIVPGRERSGDRGPSTLYTPDRAALVDHYVNGVLGLGKEVISQEVPASIKADAAYTGLLLRLTTIYPNTQERGITSREALLNGQVEPHISFMIGRYTAEGKSVIGPDGYSTFHQYLGLPTLPIAAYYERQGQPDIADLLRHHSGSNVPIPDNEAVYVLRHFAYYIGIQTAQKDTHTNGVAAARLMRDPILRLAA